MPPTSTVHQFAPVAAVGLLTIAASATHAATQATGDPGSTALTVAVVAFVVAVLVAMKRRQKIECPKSRARLTAFLLGSSVWLGTVTGIGMSWAAFEVLALMVGVLSLHWWSTHRVPNPATVEAVEVSDSLDVYADRWGEYLAGDGCALRGTRLVIFDLIEAGARYSLMLRPGRHDQSSVTSILEKVRGGLGLRDGQDLIIERHPVLPEPHQLLTIVTSSPIRADVEWPGLSTFDPATGSVALGPFVDGIGVARWRVYAGPRIKGGYVQGGTGSGKSRFLEALGISVAGAVSHPTVIMHADGQDGASCPMLAAHADVFAGTPADVRVMLAGLKRVKALRQKENKLEGWTGFTPRAERPGILVIIDEQHKFTCYLDIQADLAELAREGEKVGIAIIGASQSPLLDAFGSSNQSNNAETIRSNLLMANAMIFGSKAKDVKQVFEVDVNPSKFPPLPGYAFLANPLPGARSAPLRNYHFTDGQAKTEPQKIAWRELDPASANAYGAEYINRKEIAARKLAEGWALLEAMRAGLPAPQEAPITRTVPPANCPPPTVAQFPIWDPASLVAPPPRPVGLGEIHHRLMDAAREGSILKDGYTMPRFAAEGLGCTRRWAYEALQELVTRGYMEQRDGEPMGRYYPTVKTLSRSAA